MTAYPAKPVIAVLGAGSWGTAMASVSARNGHRTILWGRNAADIAYMAKHHRNDKYLPNLPLPENLEYTSDLDAALAAADLLEIVTPSDGFRQTVKNCQDFLLQKKMLTWATKGIEYGSNKFLHQVVQEELGQEIDMAVISGPSFAKEVLQKLPTAVTVASPNHDFAQYVAKLLHNKSWFRAYTSEDLIGVQIGGASKNVLAIAAGICDGMGYRMNTRAGMITRGLGTIAQLGTELGAKPETFMGLACMGDLILTCSDDQSRNRRFGLALASGMSPQQAAASIGQAVEGVKSAQACYQLAQQNAVEMPIVEQVYKVIYEGKKVQDATRDLLARSQKDEVE